MERFGRGAQWDRWRRRSSSAVIARHRRDGTGRPPPVGAAFVSFTVAILVVFTVAAVEPQLDIEGLGDPVLAGRLGLVGATVFGIAAMVSGHRALARRSSYLAPIATMLAAAAGWSWLTFTAAPDGQPRAAAVASGIATVIAVALLAEGLWRARWLGVFCGLGAVGISLGATLVRIGDQAGPSVALALLVAVSAMTCLYGILVEIEAGEQRTRARLLATKRQVEAEIVRTEEVLHDLRNGLLCIEATMADIDSDLGPPLRAEAARLRRLTVVADPGGVGCADLVPGLRALVSARRAAGLDVELRAPESVIVWADESEILAIADNLLSNAQRHGRAPVVVEVGRSGDHPGAGDAGPSGPDRDRVTLSVTDAGGPLVGDRPAMLFERGFTTHPLGRGLGLARARRLAIANGGQLTGTVTGDGRTSFVLSLAGNEPALDHSGPHSRLAS